MSIDKKVRCLYGKHNVYAYVSHIKAIWHFPNHTLRQIKSALSVYYNDPNFKRAEIREVNNSTSYKKPKGKILFFKNKNKNWKISKG